MESMVRGWNRPKYYLIPGTVVADADSPISGGRGRGGARDRRASVLRTRGLASDRLPVLAARRAQVPFTSRPFPLSSRRGEPPAVRRAVGAVASGDRNRPAPVPVLAPPYGKPLPHCQAIDVPHLLLRLLRHLAQLSSTFSHPWTTIQTGRAESSFARGVVRRR